MGHMTTPRKPRGIVSVRADANGDVKSTLEALNKAFAEFKAANDERIAAVEKGKADVVTAEKVDRVNAAVTEAQAKLDEAVKAANSRMDLIEASMTRIPAGGEPMGNRDVRAEAEVFLAGKKGVESDRVTDEDVRAYGEYAKTFASTFLRRGDRDMTVQAAMSVGSDPDGGYWVPTQMVNDIKRRLFETSPVRQLAAVLSITTDSVAFPTDTNDATSGGWVGETDARSETGTQQVGEQTIYVREQYAEPRVTQKLLDMATIDVEAWLNGKIADKMSRVENTAFVSGTGVKQPKGFLTYKDTAVTTADTSRAWGKLQYVASGAAGAFPALSNGASNPDALIDLVAALKPAYRAGAVFGCNRATEAALRKLKDADGNYMVDRITDGATGFTLLGFPIATMEDMPDLASDAFSLVFGNFSTGYQIVDGRGIRVLRDPFTQKPYVKFYTTKWTGGDITNFDSLKLMKFSSS